jgi:hypothetical protein
MPKPKTAKTTKNWQPFRLEDGSTRYLPDWALAPLQFDIPPDEALRQGAYSKPKNWKKAVKTKRKARR